MPFDKDLEGVENVVWPSFSKLVWFAFNKERICKEVEETWFKKHHTNVLKFWEQAGLKELGDVICMITVFGPFGWFDTGTNTIYVREDAWLGTYLHELVHLATRTSSMAYEEWEAEVGKYACLAKKMTGLVIRPCE